MGLIKLPKKSISFYKDNLDEIFESGSLAEGPWNSKLAKYINELTKATYSLPTNSNGAGIVGLLTLYRHYFGRKNVLIQSNTMYGVKTMVFASGCNLAGFVDCNIESLMPSFKTVEEKISKMSKREKESLTILLSHIGGIANPDISKIASLCKAENIILIEDCAHSFESTLNGKRTGLFGNAGVYSFYATKAIPVGEGGLVVTHDEEISNMINKFSIYDRFEQNLEPGNNIRMSEVHALLAYSVIKEWEEIIDNKSKIAQKYISACKEKGIDYISQSDNGHRGNYYKFILYSKDKPTKEVFPNLKTITSSVYDYSIGVENLLADYHVCLPIWYGQEYEVVDKVIDELS